MAFVSFEQRIQQLSGLPSPLAGSLRGIEKEALRIQDAGALALSSHPEALGSALTHPSVTTDFSESQLELITPALCEPKAALDFLADLHRYSAFSLPQGELLWGASMPGELPAAEEIPLAHYGTSTVGRIKTLYRQGLANRYGSAMQVISGIHYNFSLPQEFWQVLHASERSDLPLPEFISAGYLGMIRNVHRHGWLIPYLFGASPVLDTSLVQGISNATLQAFGFQLPYPNTHTLPWATSLRLSDLGYSNDLQAKQPIRYDNLHAYLWGLAQALTEPSDAYRALGDQQLNGQLLQLENELYAHIRPKRFSAEKRPLFALCEQGIEYVELRSLDINPFLPLGLDEAQCHFLELFMLAAALLPSPVISAQEQAVIDQRWQRVLLEGRKPGLCLPGWDASRAQPLVECSLEQMGTDFLEEMMTLADWLGTLTLSESGVKPMNYPMIVSAEMAKLSAPKLTPSAKVMAALDQHQCSYRSWMTAQARQQTQAFIHGAEAPEFSSKLAAFQRQAEDSLAQQSALEAQPQPDFTEAVSLQSLRMDDCEASCPCDLKREAC